jgi:hypothetical protein
VIELKDIRDPTVGLEGNDQPSLLEQKVSAITREKEKRDRVGPFLSQVLWNISCRLQMNYDVIQKPEK